MIFTDATGIAIAERLGVRLTHPDRLATPDSAITKAQLIAYTKPSPTACCRISHAAR